MADLKETDEPVEKARRLISPRARRDGARMDRKFSGGKLTNPSSALNRRITRRKPGHFVRNGRMLLRKSNTNPLSDLYTAIEKARGLGYQIARARLSRVAGAMGRQEHRAIRAELSGSSSAKRKRDQYARTGAKYDRLKLRLKRK